MLITSVNNEKVKELVKLKDKNYRDLKGLFFIEGLDLIDEAYKKGLLQSLYILKGYDNPYDIKDITYISPEVMKKISDTKSITPYYGVCQKIDHLTLGNKIMLLDQIQDPGNLGTIIRSAVAFNFDTIIISDDSVDLYNPKVLRSTKGMIFNIDVAVVSLIKFIDTLDDYIIYGTSAREGKDLNQLSFPQKCAFVIGNEGRGIRLEVKNKCHELIHIKMNSHCESLNAGVCASIIMYEVMNHAIY